MSDQMLEKVLDSPRLPSLPAIALQVIELVQDPNIAMKDIAATIQHDPALATKILKTVNSSFYAQPKQITTVTNALIVLGLNSVKTLALGFSLVSTMKDTKMTGFDHESYWRRSAICSAAAKVLCTEARLGEPEEAFLGGLLQDLGQLAMHSALEGEYARAAAHAQGQHRKLVAAETEHLGINHAQVGGELAAQWRLPPVLIDSIRHHEKPTDYKGESRDTLRCVALSGQIAELLDESQEVDPKRVDSLANRASTWLGIDPKGFPQLLEDVHKASREVSKLLELPGDVGDTASIMSRASDALQQVTLQAAMQVDTLEQEKVQLVKKATTDALTGASNRQAFDEFLAEQFEATQNGAGPLSVLFSDTDHFKKFNDTYGHQIGDDVLKAQAALLRELCPEGGMAARYGGEEFAYVLPDTDRRAATIFAEEVRKAIEVMESVHDDDGNLLMITNSIGVATFDGSLFRAPEQLLKAADQAVYAAKSSGRNCVRVFMPRPQKSAA